MTTGHLLFIPAVFFTGALAGFAFANRPMKPGTLLPDSPGRVRVKTLAVSFVLFFATFAVSHFAPIPGGVHAMHAALGHERLFDQDPTFSAEEVHARIGRFGEVGRDAYQLFTHTTDVIFPLSMLLFVSVLVHFVSSRISLGRGARALLTLLPFVWFASDMLENGIIYVLLSAWPSRQVVLATSLAYVSATKFVFLLAAIVAPLAVYAWRAVQLREGRTA